MIRLMAIAVLALWAALAVAQEPLSIPNLDFSQGKQGWTEWTGTTAHKWDVVPDGHGGKPALRIDAASRANDVMVMTETDKLEAGKRYQVSIWWKLENLGPGSQVDLRTIFRDKDGKWLTGTDHAARKTEEADDWTRKIYRITVPEKTVSTTFGFWVRETAGTIYISDISIIPLAATQRGFDSMYDYDPEQVPLGMTPLNAFYKLKETNSPFLPRAMRWNEMMVQTAFLQEDLSRARRLAGYAKLPAERLKGSEQAVEGILRDLDTLQQTYGRLYDAGKPEELAAQFDPAAEKLAGAIGAAAISLQGALAVKSLQVSEPWTALPQVDRSQPWWDAARKQPRYMLWTRWSDPAFWDFEKPLNMGEGHTLTAGTPSAFKDGVTSWDNYMTEWDKKRAPGAKTSSLITHYSLHDRGYLAPEFAEKHDNDPDLRMWDADGKPLGAPAGLTNINWLNPLVQGHMVDVLTQMAKFFKDKPEFQFYITSWESAGPRAGGIRVGGNPSHIAAFQQWLKTTYGDIGTLNRRWGSNYGSFEEIKPAPERALPAGEAATPLEIESNRWAHDAYREYIALITKSLNAVDDSKPVWGQQSGIPSRMFDPRLMDAVNILGHHNRAGTTMPVQVWLNSLRRLHKTPGALFENFWGCQEDHPQRLAEERAMRAQMRRYLYRHAAWGNCAQTWWYAYTSAPYLLTYNGNFFNPVYDLTTMRYAAAGYPVERAKVDRVEAAILGSEIVPSRIVLVQPYSSMLAQGSNTDTLREWLAWHGLLYPRNLLYEVLPDDYFEAGRVKLSDFDVAILPFATHLTEAFSKQLIEFARAGGTVICSGPAGLYTELGQPNGALLTAASLQPTRLGQDGEWRYSYGAGDKSRIPFVEAPLGKGRVLALKQPLAGLKGEAEALAGLVRQRAVPVAEAPGTTLELLPRRLPDGRMLLCALNADPDQATAGEVSIAGSFSKVADLDMPLAVRVPAKTAAGRTSFRVSLDPGTTAYFVLAK